MAVTGHGLIYPDSTGNVNLWEHIQALADSAETAFDTNELDSGWVAIGGGVITGTLRYRSYRGIVFVQVDGTASFTNGTVTTLNPSNALAADLRPTVAARGGAYFAAFAGILTVGTDGNISAVQNTGATRASISGIVSYPLG